MKLEAVIGNNIKRARQAHGWSQRQLGEQLAAELRAPWAPQQVSEAERGLRHLAAVELVALAGALDISVTQLTQPDGDHSPVELWSGKTISADELKARVRGKANFRLLAEAVDKRNRLADLLKVTAERALDEVLDEVLDEAVDLGYFS